MGVNNNGGRRSPQYSDTSGINELTCNEIPHRMQNTLETKEVAIEGIEVKIILGK